MGRKKTKTLWDKVKYAPAATIWNGVKYFGIGLTLASAATFGISSLYNGGFEAGGGKRALGRIGMVVNATPTLKQAGIEVYDDLKKYVTYDQMRNAQLASAAAFPVGAFLTVGAHRKKRAVRKKYLGR